MRSLRALIRHLRHHARFYVAALLGVLTYFALPLVCGGRGQSLRPIIAGDLFFGVYLAAMMMLLRGATSEKVRQHTRQLDETAPFIFILTAIAVALGITDIFKVLHDPALTLTTRIGLGIFSVVVAWSALHVAAAFHYAHLYHRLPHPGPSHPNASPDAGGLMFPGSETPELWDFLYFSFVIGMTAQVSDVQVSASHMRRFVLLHGIASFFFNAIIIALAVNVAAGLST